MINDVIMRSLIAAIEVNLKLVSLFDCGPFLRPDRNSTSAVRNRGQCAAAVSTVPTLG
jgi:hypothetical protein